KKGAIADFSQTLALDPMNTAAYNSREQLRPLSEELAGILRIIDDGNKQIKLYVNPDMRGSTQTAKALNAHRIHGDYLGKVLIHWNTSAFRGKNGIIVFDKGILVSQFLEKTKLFYFGNPDQSWHIKACHTSKTMNIKIEGYCALDGRINSEKLDIPLDLSTYSLDLPKLLNNTFRKLHNKSQYFRTLSRYLANRFKESDASFMPSTAYADDIYDQNLQINSIYLGTFKFVQASLGALPVPSEVILLVNCGLAQSFLISASGINLIGKEIFTATMRFEHVYISWKSLRSVDIDAIDYPRKTIHIRIDSNRFSGVIKLSFNQERKFAPARAVFSNIAIALVDQMQKMHTILTDIQN
ncbi:hypothetical protein NZK32_04120, partial [Cyanobium sp. FGCU-52]|nr:hypothetical protein [Cyanobium sp. FGCU52]